MYLEGDILKVLDKASGAIIKPYYEYEVIGTEQITQFLKDYLTRLEEWALKAINILINKTNCLINCQTDIVENANTKIWCVDNFAQIGQIKVSPIDTPQVSFGESAIYKFNGGKFTPPSKNSFVFNIFNNQWGANFQQWIEGDFNAEYIVESVKE